MNSVRGSCFKIVLGLLIIPKRAVRLYSSNQKLKELLITMPKETVHVPGLKEGRRVKREVAPRYPAGTISLQVLGSGAKGAPRSLYVFTDQSRYLFNCGEGTQRLAHEHKMKLAKLEHIFITNKSWDNTGGLPGVALTIQDIGVPEITLHGPPNLEQIFEGTKRFVILKDLKVKVASCSSDGYNDHIMEVDYVKLTPYKDEYVEKSSSSEESVIEEDDTDYYAPIKGCKRNIEITTDDGENKRSKVETDATDTEECKEDPETVLCYICRPRKKEGTLLIEKCVELGVPPGPLLGKLKSGQDVTLPNGNSVKADEVRCPDFPSPLFMVVDCPNERYLDSFMHNPILNNYHNPEDDANLPHVVIHFTPLQIMIHPKYKEWMEKFRGTTKHLVMNESCLGMGSEAVHRIQHKLGLLDEDMFPPLSEDGVHLFYPTNSESDSDNLNKLRIPAQLNEINVPIMMGSTLLKYGLRPIAELDSTSTLKINREENVREVLENEEFPPLLETLKASLNSINITKELYPEFIFFGTGSCIPNKTRNTSAILVHTDPSSCFLMDCGEGTYGQMVRFYGNQGADDILSKLKLIYISHLHADHHIGLIQVLRKRMKVFMERNIPLVPVYLLAPHQILTWLNLYNTFFEKIKHSYQLIPNTELRYDFTSEKNHEILIREIKHLLQFDTIQTSFVKHCPNAFGVAFTHTSGWKLTYSGDTMPCLGLIDIGKDSDILIHESTMEDDLKQEAVIKMHSTTSEAIEVGNQMNAKFILLTHFSQRYAKVPLINEKFGSNVGIAFDNMRIRKCDLPKIPLMYDALKVMFTESMDEMEQKSMKRMRRKQFDAMNLKQMAHSGS